MRKFIVLASVFEKKGLLKSNSFVLACLDLIHKDNYFGNNIAKKPRHKAIDLSVASVQVDALICESHLIIFIDLCENGHWIYRCIYIYSHLLTYKPTPCTTEGPFVFM